MDESNAPPEEGRIQQPHHEQSTISTHGAFPDEPATLEQRRRSRLGAGFALAALTVCAMVGAALPSTLGMLDAAPPEFATAFFMVAGIVAAVAGLMEFMRARRAETVAVFAFALGVAASWAATLNGWYYFQPFLLLATLATGMALVHRAIVRDEGRHEVSEEVRMARRPRLRGRAH